MSLSHEYYLPLEPARHLELVAALGDSPETVIAVHHLRRGAVAPMSPAMLRTSMERSSSTSTHRQSQPASAQNLMS